MYEWLFQCNSAPFHINVRYYKSYMKLDKYSWKVISVYIKYSHSRTDCGNPIPYFRVECTVNNIKSSFGMTLIRVELIKLDVSFWKVSWWKNRSFWSSWKVIIWKTRLVLDCFWRRFEYQIYDDINPE